MRLLEALLPERCAVCAAPGAPLCPTCNSRLTRLRPPVCDRCGAPGPWPVRRCAECAGRRLAFASARSALVYDSRARALVQAWKEHARRRLAREVAPILVDAVKRPSVDALVHVPGDPERARERGAVTAEQLARELSSLWGLPSRALLRRTRSLPRQRGLDLAARRRNVRDSVVATGEPPAVVCLVDDVYTSGSTADACARTLRRAGARRVEVVTLARAVR